MGRGMPAAPPPLGGPMAGLAGPIRGIGGPAPGVSILLWEGAMYTYDICIDDATSTWLSSISHSIRSTSSRSSWSSYGKHRLM